MDLEAKLKARVDELKSQLTPLRLRTLLPGAPPGVGGEIDQIQHVLGMERAAIGLNASTGQLDEKSVNKALSDHAKAITRIDRLPRDGKKS